MKKSAVASTDVQDEGTPRGFFNLQDGVWHIQLTQGQCYVTDNPQEVLTTLLGSCIAACIRDPAIGIGGMNHFLLPEGGDSDRYAQRYGVNAMELLINGILKRGGRRERFEAKLFGGANVVASLSDVGVRNVEFARTFLANEGIRITGGNVGGKSARKVQFWPVSGRARQLSVKTDSANLAEREISCAMRQLRHPAHTNDDIELF